MSSHDLKFRMNTFSQNIEKAFKASSFMTHKKNILMRRITFQIAFTPEVLENAFTVKRFLEVSRPDVCASQTSVGELPGCQFNDPHLLHHQQRPMRRTDTKECNSLPGSQPFSLGPLCLNAGLVCQLPSCHRGQIFPRQTQWAYCALDETAMKPR